MTPIKDQNKEIIINLCGLIEEVHVQAGIIDLLEGIFTIIENFNPVTKQPDYDVSFVSYYATNQAGFYPNTYEGMQLKVINLMESHIIAVAQKHMDNADAMKVVEKMNKIAKRH